MLIDGFTILAQIVNFLILIWLLKRFLYKPILNAIDERDKYIAMQVQQAEAQKTDAIKELHDYNRMKDEFAQQRQSLLNTAIGEVDHERIRLLDELNNELNTLRGNYYETLRNEQQTLGAQIVYRTQTEVFEIVRKALYDLASVSLEAQMVTTLFNRLQSLSPDEKDLFLTELKQSKNHIIIHSSFALPIDLQNSIATELSTLFAIETNIQYETDATLISGITIMVGGFKIIWSIDEYLTSFKNNLIDTIQEKYESQ